MNRNVFVLLLTVKLLSGCDIGPSKAPVESLSFEEKKAIMQQCQQTGKIATDKYCKQVAVVFNKENHERNEQARVNKAMKQSPLTGAQEIRQ